MPSLETWFRDMPPITKVTMVSTLGSAACFSFGLVDPYKLALVFEPLYQRFEIWRLLTNAVFLGGFGMSFVFNFFMLVQTYQRLEAEYYRGNRGTAELVFVLIFGLCVLTVIAFLVPPLPFLSQPLLYYVIYIWSRKNPEQPVGLWGFQFQAWQFPFALLVLNMLMGSSMFTGILGILVGHLFHFLHNIVPIVYGTTVLKTPQFLYDLFEVQQVNRPASFGGQGHSLR